MNVSNLEDAFNNSSKFSAFWPKHTAIQMGLKANTFASAHHWRNGRCLSMDHLSKHVRDPRNQEGKRATDKL